MNKYDITTVAETKTCFKADVVEACRTESEVFVACGQYQLLQDNRTRVGSLCLYHMKPGESFRVEKSWSVPAVLDCRWLDPQHVAVACANGTVVIVPWKSKDTVFNEFLIDSRSLILSLDFDLQRSVIICSDSLGTLSLLDAHTGRKHSSCKAHSAEGWCVSFCGESLCCSGGDDGKLTFWDIRCKKTSISLPVDLEWSTTLSLSHQGVGITSILPIMNRNLLLTGGYDDHLVGHDMRMLDKSLFKYPLGGGVWRIRQHPSQLSYFLAATMYDGFKFFQLDFCGVVNDLHRFGGESCASTIAYGVCWLPVEEEMEAVTCTFYDGLVQHWKFQEKTAA
jgi:diphthamide biosynthesis protein 7